MTTASVVKDTDASAPDIRPQDGVAAALRFSLVTNGNWTEPFTAASNVAVFRSPTGEGGYYLRVDESNAGYAILTGYGAMTDLSTGDDRFPDSGTDLYFRNYFSNVSTDPETWSCYSTDKAFWLVHKYRTNATYTTAIFFGRPNIGVPSASSAWDCCLIAKTGSSSSNSDGHFSYLNTTNGGYWIRDIGGASGHEPCFRDRVGSSGYIGAAGFSYPVNGGLAWNTVTVADDSSSDSPRGWLPGLINVFHAKPFAMGDTFTMSGDFANGASCEVYDSYFDGIMVFTDHTDLWD